jgi:hypothetical protein
MNGQGAIMLDIQAASLPNGVINPRSTQSNQMIETHHFDALLMRFEVGSASDRSPSDSNPIYGFIEELLENIALSLNNHSGAITPQALPSKGFGFTAAFESAFGIGGPLPAFINKVTAERHLNEAQNLALQNIAIRNKDVTKTPESVQKIAMELKQAGIS